MNWKYKVVRVLAIIAVLILFLNLEIAFVLPLVIDAIGFDMFVLLTEFHIISILTFIFATFIEPIVEFSRGLIRSTNNRLMSLDPLYFIPSRSIAIQYPPVMAHAVPFFVSLYLWILTCGIEEYDIGSI